jgi:hypothetical protein
LPLHVVSHDMHVDSVAQNACITTALYVAQSCIIAVKHTHACCTIVMKTC